MRSKIARLFSELLSDCTCRDKGVARERLSAIDTIEYTADAPSESPSTSSISALSLLRGAREIETFSLMWKIVRQLLPGNSQHYTGCGAALRAKLL